MESLRRWMSDNGKSQAALAALVGVKQPTVWEWLHGDAQPSATNLKKLSEVTGLSVDAILENSSAIHTSRSNA